MTSPRTPPEGAIAWTRFERPFTRNRSRGLDVVAYESEEQRVGYSLDLVRKAEDALAAIDWANDDSVMHWVLDADLSAPLLITHDRPSKGAPVALVATRNDGDPDLPDAVGHTPAGGLGEVGVPGSAHCIGLMAWPVWFGAPGDAEEGSA